MPNENVLSTKGQMNDNKLTQDDYDDNDIIIRQALEHLQLSYDLFKDYKSGLANETNRCWRKQVLQLLEQANNLAVFSVHNGLVAVPKINEYPDRMIGSAKVSFSRMGGLAVGDEEDDEVLPW